MEDLKWEVEQKQREIEAQKQQLEMMEQCHHRELDNVQKALQASAGWRQIKSLSTARLRFSGFAYHLSLLSYFPPGDFTVTVKICSEI